MLAAQNTLEWINTEHVYHIKNGYEPFSGFGCEPYGYFHKYMVTVASFAHFAYLLADESIEQQPCVALNENYIHRTGEHFHKTFVKFGEYFLEYETRADFHYDCNGLGRIHRKGAPSAICLSVPVTSTPNYGLDIENPGPFSLCAGMETDGKMQYSCEAGASFELLEQSVTDEAARVLWRVTLPGGKSFTEECIASGDGVSLKYTCGERISVLLPAYEGDGWRRSEMEVGGNAASIRYEGFECCYTASAPIALRPEVYANRNGHYRALQVSGNGTVQLDVCIRKI